MTDTETIIDIYQAINMVVLAIVSLCGGYMAGVMFWWWYRLRQADSTLRPFFLALVGLFLAICYLAMNSALAIIDNDIVPTARMFAARAVLMVSSLIMAYVTLHYYKGGSDVPQKGTDNAS